MDDFYVYVHLRGEEQTSFYVGKGRGSRAFARLGRSQEWLDEAKDGYKIRIVESNVNERHALQVEKMLIKCLRAAGISLVNVSAGGVGEYDAQREAASKSMASRTGYRNHMAGRTGAACAHSRAVVCTDDGAIFTSVAAAANAYGLAAGNVSRVCKGSALHAGGKRFRYACDDKAPKPNLVRPQRPVKDRETGKIYVSARAAAKELGMSRARVTAQAKVRSRFEFAHGDVQ